MFMLNSIIHAHHNEHLNITYEKVIQYEQNLPKWASDYDSGFRNVWPNILEFCDCFTGDFPSRTT